jgi:hypothetical protein
LERERDQVYTQLREVERASKDLTERIKNVQSEQVILQSEHAQFEIEKNLWQKAKIIPELFEEGMKFYRKLMVEDHHQQDAEEKLSKVKENISRKTAELQTYTESSKKNWREPNLITKGRLFPMRRKLTLIGWRPRVLKNSCSILGKSTPTADKS